VGPLPFHQAQPRNQFEIAKGIFCPVLRVEIYMLSGIGVLVLFQIHRLVEEGKPGLTPFY